MAGLMAKILQQHDLQSAGKLMVTALYLAAKLDREHSVALWLARELEAQSLTLRGLRQQFEPPVALTVHTNQFIQHSLLDYDLLLNAQGRYLA